MQEPPVISSCSSPPPSLQLPIFLERERSCFPFTTLLSVDNICLKTARQSALSLDLPSIKCLTLSLQIQFSGESTERDLVHLTYSQCKPDSNGLNGFSFIQRKRVNDLYLPLHIHMQLIIIQPPVYNSFSYVCIKKHETGGFLPPWTN